MYEATAVTSWPQMGVFLSAGHLDAPHRLPGLIKLAVNWVNPRVVRSHCIAHISWDAMLLKKGRCGDRTGGQQINEEVGGGQARRREKSWCVLLV